MTFAQALTSFLVIFTILHVFLLGTAYLILLERKIASWAQDRIGPNRVGPLGLLQPIADGLKFFTKEEFTPSGADKLLFLAAPAIAVVPAILGWAVIPWGGVWDAPLLFTIPDMAPFTWVGLAGAEFGGLVHFTALNVNIGVIYILAMGSLAVYGVVIGAWAQNNKYAFFGGLRATAQMLSYEIPMGIMVLCVLLMAGSSAADDIVTSQVGYWHGIIPSWYIFQQPIAAILFFVCILAESNRAPFDLAECEQELIAGFHTEYSSMKFALFFLGEYIHMLAASAFLSVLFLGGWHAPFVDLLISKIATGEATAQPLMHTGLLGLLGVGLKIGVLLAKVVALVALMMWVRWTLPRFRFDQLMKLAWRALIPLSLVLLLVTGTFTYFDLNDYLWVANIAIIVGMLIIMPFLPKDTTVNRRVPLSGSRFSPLES